ncbi:MAG: hypothetical protein JWQ30_431 [Sediminibacterium sp.]|nr:hypothetical protein [Sediminibacterium sp.]
MNLTECKNAFYSDECAIVNSLRSLRFLAFFALLLYTCTYRVQPKSGNAKNARNRNGRKGFTQLIIYLQFQPLFQLFNQRELFCDMFKLLFAVQAHIHRNVFANTGFHQYIKNDRTVIECCM